MKTITGPIDGLTLLNRAVTFGNMKDLTDAKAACNKLRVLPPGAPYVITSSGLVRVTARLLPRAKRVQKCHMQMRRILKAASTGKVPTTGAAVRVTLLPVGKLTPVAKKRTLINFGGKWFRVQRFDRDQVVEDDALIVPTLDALVAASAAVLSEHGDHIKECVVCKQYWIRPSGKRVTCSKECAVQKKKMENKKNQATWRSKPK